MIALKIEVVSTEFKQFSGMGKNGKPYDMAMQSAYLHRGAAYPDKFEVPLKKVGEGENARYVPYPVGWYLPTPDSFQVRDSRLAINAFELQLVALTADQVSSKPRAVG